MISLGELVLLLYGQSHRLRVLEGIYIDVGLIILGKHGVPVIQSIEVPHVLARKILLHIVPVVLSPGHRQDCLLSPSAVNRGILIRIDTLNYQKSRNSPTLALSILLLLLEVHHHEFSEIY